MLHQSCNGQYAMKLSISAIHPTMKTSQFAHIAPYIGAHGPSHNADNKNLNILSSFPMFCLHIVSPVFFLFFSKMMESHHNEHNCREHNRDSLTVRHREHCAVKPEHECRCNKLY